jgi:hypothetical protein
VAIPADFRLALRDWIAATRDGERQLHQKLAAPPWALARRADGAAMHLDEPLDERQADAEPSLIVHV